MESGLEPVKMELENIPLVLSLNTITSAARQPPTPKPTPPVTILSLNYDVLARIFEEFDRPLSFGDCFWKKQLFWAALTCRAFQSPALDALWISLHSVFPLLQLLPTIEYVNGVHYLRGEISNHDKERFNFYAKKVRVLTLDGNCGAIDPSIFNVLPPLPCLHKIICWSFAKINVHNTLLFVPSTIRAVMLLPSRSFSCPCLCDYTSMHLFLCTLLERAPHIHHLVLTGSARVPARVPWDSVLNFQTLRSLELEEGVDLMTFRNIASLPELQRLTVHGIFPSCLREGSLNSDDDIVIPCIKLRSLIISGSDYIIASYLSRMRGGCLSDISIRLINDPQQAGPWPWETCLTTMAQQWASTLRYLCLDARSLYHIDTSPQFFISLSNIRALEHLVIKAQVTWSQYHSLASAIPHIKTVDIYEVNGPPLSGEGDNCGSGRLFGCSNPDLFDEFALNCPHLVSLSVNTFDEVYSPSVPFLPNHRYRHNQLRTLRIASEDMLDVDNVQHAIDVARHLDHRFPSLKVIHARGRSRDFWKYVEKLVHDFQRERVRQQTVERWKEVEGFSQG